MNMYFLTFGDSGNNIFIEEYVRCAEKRETMQATQGLLFSLAMISYEMFPCAELSFRSNYSECNQI